MHTRAIGVVALAALGGCSSGGGGALTCETLRGESCWKSALAEVRTCGGQSADGGAVASGTLDAAGQICTYPDGREVLFDAPVTLPLSSSKDLGFTVKVSGQTCFSFTFAAGPPQAYELTVSAGTVRFEGLAPDQARLTCPDGATYTGSYNTLLGCGATYEDKSEILPSIVWQSGPNTGGIELNGAGPDSPVTLFHCQK